MTNAAHKKTPKRIQYQDCGLDNVWIEGGFEVVNSPYGTDYAIKDLDGLHRCIGYCLVRKAGPLTGKEFKFLRTELDLSQSTMGELCGRKERMVRQWENRDEPVEEPANTIIRVVYEQRSDTSAKYEELAKLIRQLQLLDKEIHEMKFKLKNAKEGWQPEECLKAA